MAEAAPEAGMDEGMEENLNEKAFEEDTSSTENAKSKIESMIRARKAKVLLTIFTIFTYIDLNISNILHLIYFS